jgi:hypothetical protein
MVVFILKYPFFLFIQKDKRKVPSVEGTLRHICYPAITKRLRADLPEFPSPSPPLPKRPFRAQNDKHSDLAACGASLDTVMAVATDSHRDFLIPEHPVSRDARQRTDFSIPMNCVYSFVGLL